jgi:hypothetical protein
MRLWVEPWVGKCRKSRSFFFFKDGPQLPARKASSVSSLSRKRTVNKLRFIRPTLHPIGNISPQFLSQTKETTTRQTIPVLVTDEHRNHSFSCHVRLTSCFFRYTEVVDQEFRAVGPAEMVEALQVGLPIADVLIVKTVDDVFAQDKASSMIAMCAAGPPKAVVPSRRKNKASS